MDELRQRELLPFAAMVQAGASIIMSAHILYPEIDPETPATLSPLFLNGVLRGELGFKGVITTDDIGMGAVSALFDRPSAAASALNAGCDLIMMSAHWTDTNRVMSLAQNLLEGLNRGELDSGTFEASQQRIERLLSSAPMHSVEALPKQVLERHGALQSEIAAARDA